MSNLQKTTKVLVVSVLGMGEYSRVRTRTGVDRPHRCGSMSVYPPPSAFPVIQATVK